MNREIADMRENYTKGFLDESTIHKDPIQQFENWFSEASNGDIAEPNAMILSTVDSDGSPSSRTVLLKEIDKQGFIFYTNYNSDKAKDIENNDNVCLLFLWKEQERQVRISGRAQKVEVSKSQSYFHSRPKGSQIGAWTSPQSDVIMDREILETKKKEIETQYQDSDVLPLPPFWGGYIVKPTSVEFWQGRPSRLHDRLRYRKGQKNEWLVERLAP